MSVIPPGLGLVPFRAFCGLLAALVLLAGCSAEYMGTPTDATEIYSHDSAPAAVTRAPIVSLRSEGTQSKAEMGNAGSAPAAVAGSLSSPTSTPTALATPKPETDLTRLWNDGVFHRKDLIYGSQIGSWPFQGRYDSYPLLTNPACQAISKQARIPVYRWMPWKPFTDLGGDMTDTQFERIIDGIQDTGAMVLIALPPVVNHQCAPQADVRWLKEIISRAGNRVVLYEFGNEPNYYCDWSPAHYAQEWIRVVPELKRYARSQGTEIYIGGPAWSNPWSDAIRELVTTTASVYKRTGDEDVIPSFLSFHAYGSLDRREPGASILARVPSFGELVTQAQQMAIKAFGVRIPVAITEWNFTVDTRDRRDLEKPFIWAFTTDMLGEFRARKLWLANQFIFASGDDNLDMVDTSCNTKPMFDAFVQHRASNSD